MKAEGNFAEGSVREHIFRLAWPMIVVQLVGILYNVVDRMFIGHMSGVGGAALTGLGVVFPLITLVNAFANWGGQGGAALFAMARGRGEEEKARQIQGNAVFLLFLFTLFLLALGYGLEGLLLRAFGGSEKTLPFASAYLRIYLLGTFFQLFSLGMNPFIAAQGHPRQGMAAVIAGALTNLVLDPIFIFLLGMGIRGAALATVFAQAVSCFWELYFLCARGRKLRLDFAVLKPKPGLLWDILLLGFANFLFQLTNSLTQAVSNSVLLAYGGDIQVGIMTVVITVRQIFYMPINGITNAAKPVMSFNFGAGKGERVVRGIRVMTFFCISLTVAVTLLVMLFPAQLLRLFTSDARLIGGGIIPLRIYFLFFIWMSFQTAGQSTFTSLGLAREATFFSLLRKVFLIVPLTLLLPLWLGALGVYWAEAISQLLGGSACYGTMYRRVVRRLRAGLAVRD